MKRLILALGLLLMAGAVQAALLAPESARAVGDRSPIFALVGDRGDLVSYDHDYYGRHHLVLTFFPAAFTPV